MQPFGIKRGDSAGQNVPGKNVPWKSVPGHKITKQKLIMQITDTTEIETGLNKLILGRWTDEGILY